MNQRAAAIVAELTGEVEPEKAQEPPAKPRPTPEERSAAASILGRIGGPKGGRARAAKLTPERRRAIAKKAAEVRWSKP